MKLSVFSPTTRNLAEEKHGSKRVQPFRTSSQHKNHIPFLIDNPLTAVGISMKTLNTFPEIVNQYQFPLRRQVVCDTSNKGTPKAAADGVDREEMTNSAVGQEVEANLGDAPYARDSLGDGRP